MDDSFQIWIWKDGDYYVGYQSFKPCDGNGDPLVLGEPVGRCFVKPSFSLDLFKVLNAQPIQDPQPEPNQKDAEQNP